MRESEGSFFSLLKFVSPKLTQVGTATFVILRFYRSLLVRPICAAVLKLTREMSFCSAYSDDGWLDPRLIDEK